MGTRPVWLALLMVVMVASLCLSQRMGLLATCPTHSTPAAEAPLLSAAEGQCHLSERLLSQGGNQLEPLLIGLLLTIMLWLLPALPPGIAPGAPPPLPATRHRRHLLLCVFRE
ncbi:hypothetical protein C7H85_12715 [Zobellella endophytica]|uniref:Copper resistance protein n=2 Tax=Zobellella endophytica TaxID=2116700 RepID=A0A2P7R3Q7_9GAMM|nr:hypothetical protein C7H85_12715 [Zobellella endophytica]